MISLERRIPACAGLMAAVLIAASAAAQPATAQDAPPKTTLTIYSTARPGAISPDLYRPLPGSAGGGSGRGRSIPGYAVVKQERAIDLGKGRTIVRFTDVAAHIDPTTVAFESLTDPAGTSVIEQNYQFDLVSTDKLMERYLDKQITVEQARGDTIETITGTLLSTAGGLVLKTPTGIMVINGYSNVQFPELPGGLITKPTLVWDIATDKPGRHDARVTYQTKALTWWTDYNIVFADGENANQGVLDIGAWVSIINRSGASYHDARIKLIAGDVHRAPEPRRFAEMDMAMARGVRAAAPGFQEKAFFEFHLYTLGRPTTLPGNSTKQIQLFPAVRGVPCDKVLVYYGLAQRFGVFGNPMMDRNFGTQSNKKVDVYLKFRNAEGHGMGMPLPSGRIRVSKLDPSDQSLEFIGEDVIDHTPKDEEILIKMGSAFDVVGERKQVDFKLDRNRKVMEETVEIKLRNHKDEAVEVIVKENLYRWVEWRITNKTHDYKKIDSRTVHFPVRVAKDGETAIRYTVKYTW